MQAKESGASDFNLPDRILQLLPSDPFEQLDVARKITSIALSSRVSLLESDSSALRSKLAEKDEIVADLRFQLESLHVSLYETADKLARADEEKESLEEENASLSNIVKNLNRDVAKLEVFRKTLMISLQEEEEEGDSPTEVPEVVAKIHSHPTTSTVLQNQEEVSSSWPSRYSSVQSQSSEVGNSLEEEEEDDDSDSIRARIAPGLLLASQASTPWLNPRGFPPSLSASGSPKRTTSRPVSPSPRQHSVSFSNSRNNVEDNSSVNSSAPLSHHGSIPSNKGGSRVSGREFFQQVRTRLSFEEFDVFLTNVKDLNNHKQTRKETLRKAEEIFGDARKDLYAIFEELINAPLKKKANQKRSCQLEHNLTI